ncbi:hypothetical protein AB0J52_06115 [Spirillospora sp. NPDC049652]
MSGLVAPPADDLGERRRRAVTAMLRAAHAWAARRERPEAMGEVARMTGFVMEAHGPGSGPVTPLALVDALRRPLGELPIFTDADDAAYGALREVVLLAPDEEGRDRLSAAAHDLACEHVVPLDSDANTNGWLPSWTRMNADRIRTRTFAAMAGPNDQRLYVASRRFLIEHPAGLWGKLREMVAESGARLPPEGYQAIPWQAVFRTPDGGAWWWPCPDCRWPMVVTGEQVRCGYQPHSVLYCVDQRSGLEQPELARIDEGRVTATPEALPAEGSVCVAQAVWRFVVVPGASELRIAESLGKLGADVELWPQMDAYDLRVRVRGEELRFDVKEYRSPHRLIAALRDRPPSGRVRVLLPRTHEHQAETIRTALPGLTIDTEQKLVQRVRRITQDERRKESRR